MYVFDRNSRTHAPLCHRCATVQVTAPQAAAITLWDCMSGLVRLFLTRITKETHKKSYGFKFLELFLFFF